MDALFRLLITNAAAAGLLALGAWGASRLVKRPAVVHGLWLLALAKLVTPPVMPLPVLTGGRSLLSRSQPPRVVRIAPRALTPAPPLVAPMESPAVPGPEDTLMPSRGDEAAPARGPKAVDFELATRLLLALGVLATVVLTGWRFLRFRRLLEHAMPAPPPITARTREIAHRLGLRRAPPVLLVPARIPPMLWPASGGPRLLIPDELLPQLDDAERDALLAHELAHVRRRDHWVRLLEIAVTALFWWYPVTWWARRALRNAEERCCDQWVLRLLPASAGAYALGLLKSLTFVSREGVSTPVAASGVGPARDLETRLKEILMTKPLPQLSAPLRLALAAGAAVGLAVFPTHAQSPATDRDTPEAQGPSKTAPTPRASAPTIAARPLGAAPIAAAVPAAPLLRLTAPVGAAAPVTRVPQAAAPAPVRAATSSELVERKLDAQRRAIEKERRELRERQRALERQGLELESRAEQEEMQAEAASLRAAGNAGRAALVERKMAAAKRQVEVKRRQLRFDAERAALVARLEAAGQEREDRVKALDEAGREAEAEKLKHEMEAAQREEERASQELSKQQQAIEREMREAEEQMQGLAAEEHVHELRAGTDELLRSLTEQVAAIKEELPQATVQKAKLEREIRRLEAAIAALAKTP